MVKRGLAVLIAGLLLCASAQASARLSVAQAKRAVTVWTGGPLPGGSVTVGNCHRKTPLALNCRVTYAAPIDISGQRMYATFSDRVRVKEDAHGAIRVRSGFVF